MGRLLSRFSLAEEDDVKEKITQEMVFLLENDLSATQRLRLSYYEKAFHDIVDGKSTEVRSIPVDAFPSPPTD